MSRLTFSGVPTAMLAIDYGDIHALTDDGHTLVIERKTPEDLLNTLRDARLLPQMARMVQTRLDEQARQGTITTWPYLVITGTLYEDERGLLVFVRLDIPQISRDRKDPQPYTHTEVWD